MQYRGEDANGLLEATKPPNIEMEPTLPTIHAIMSSRSAAHFAR
jgi:hypothetical protein